MAASNLDWKVIVALGTTAVNVIFALKMDGETVEHVSIHAIDAIKDCAIAFVSNC